VTTPNHPTGGIGQSRAWHGSCWLLDLLSMMRSADQFVCCTQASSQLPRPSLLLCVAAGKGGYNQGPQHRMWMHYLAFEKSNPQVGVQTL
jgi:hypothetical protein